MITTINGKARVAASQLDTAEALAPASKVVKLTAGQAIPTGGCRFFWSSGGTITGKDGEGNTITNFPTVAGRNDISLTELTALGTATEIWGCW